MLFTGEVFGKLYFTVSESTKALCVMFSQRAKPFILANTVSSDHRQIRVVVVWTG